MKKCKVCREKFTPRSPLQAACGIECALAIVADKRGKKAQADQKQEKKADRAKREKLKSRADWLREAQTAFNAFIRARDAGKPCISCGRHHQGQYHAGHYLSVGARPELRFNELNNNLQCAPCNTYLSGNAVLYRKALIDKIGLDMVEWLEGPHEPKKYAIDEIKAIKKEYTQKLKELK